MNVYKVGEAVSLKADFEVGGVDTDPGIVTLTITDPTGTATVPSPTRDSTGRYHYTLDLTAGAIGVWNYTWVGSTPAQAVKDGAFIVEDTAT